VGQIVSTSNSPTSKEVQNIPSKNRTGEIGSTASRDLFLPAGNYTVRAVVAVTPANGSTPASTKAARFLVTSFGPTLLDDDYSLANFTAGAWISLNWTVSTAVPLPDVVVEADLLSANVALAVAEVTVTAQ
jgi:hypothetical protein